MKKVLLVVVCVLIFATANIVSTTEIAIKEQLGLLIVYLLGLHFVYGYLFKTEIHMTGYTVRVGERPALRLGLLVAGLGVMLGAVVYVLGLV